MLVAQGATPSEILQSLSADHPLITPAYKQPVARSLACAQPVRRYLSAYLWACVHIPSHTRKRRQVVSRSQTRLDWVVHIVLQSIALERPAVRSTSSQRLSASHAEAIARVADGCATIADSVRADVGGDGRFGLALATLHDPPAFEGSASSLARNEASALGLAATATRSAVLLSGPVLVPHSTAAQVSQELCVA
jgi:hypothetical protein